jgi:hypothetical protein
MKSLVIAVAVLCSAGVVMWRQTPDALLRVGSFPSAVSQVVFWSSPALALYVLVVWSRAAIITAGLALVAILTATWWSSATDWHSTAALGPGLVGFVALPVLMIAAGSLEAVVAWRRRRSGEAEAGARTDQ